MTTGTNPGETSSDEPAVLRVFQSKEETKAFYNKIARVYDLLSEQSERPVRDKGLARLDARPNEQILEIGFGTGHCLLQLARSVGANGKVYGLDLSEKMLEISRELLEKKGVADRVELVCGDALSLPWKNDSMDGIFMSLTLELFDTPEIPGLLSECKRVLKPGGRLVVVSLSKTGKQGLVLKTFEWTHKHFPNLMDCRPIYVQQVIQDAGFNIVKTDIEQMWVPVEIVWATKP